MKFVSTMLVVSDIDKAVDFYKKVLGLEIVADFGANKTLTGGVALQTLSSYKDFIEKRNINFGGNNFELYFEEDNFDDFIDRLKRLDIKYIHKLKEHSWGQRVIRFYDLDENVIEVGENMISVCKRFIDTGMTVEQVAKRMDVPFNYVKQCIGDYSK